MAETAEKVECSPLRGGIWSENVCGVGRAPWGDVGMWLLSHPHPQGYAGGACQSPEWCEGWSLWGSHPAGDPDKSPHGGAHECGVPAACSLGRMEGEAAVCKEGEPQLPREGDLHTGAPLQQRAGSSWWETLHDVLTWYPKDLPDPGIEPISFVSPALLTGGFSTTSATWEARVAERKRINKQEPQLNRSRETRRGLPLASKDSRAQREDGLASFRASKETQTLYSWQPSRLPAFPLYKSLCPLPVQGLAQASCDCTSLNQFLCGSQDRASLLEKWLLVLGQYYFNLGSGSWLC